MTKTILLIGVFVVAVFGGLIIMGDPPTSPLYNSTVSVNGTIINPLRIYVNGTLLSSYIIDVVPQGPMGPQGEQDIQGEMGLTGPQGYNGTQGIQGIQGEQGIQGLKGDTGETGLKGDTGDQGTQGIPGDPGAKGDTGEQGLTGDTGEQGIQGEPGPPYTPPSYQQYSLINAYPMGGAMATLTPTTHAATVARVYPFELDRPITVNQIDIRTNAALANCLILGIFDSTGSRVWTSGVLSTLATRWVKITVNLPITLSVGTYYFATTNNNVASTTGAYTVTPALGGADLPRWGTVPTTSGAMPSSINPAAITETVGGWMCYVLLSNVLT